MKASLKFREDDKKPLFRAKVPLNILGMPFQSGLVAGDSKELALSLGTLFESGPALRLSYRPNNPSNPFSLVLKTGIGAFGSPIDAPMTMSAEFNLLNNGSGSSSNPSFFLHFKPRFGDLSIRKSQSSSTFSHHRDSTSSSAVTATKRGAGNGSSDDDEGSIESPVMVNGDYLSGIGALNGPKLTALASRSTSSVAATIESALAGMELGARTLLPIRNGAVVKLRWGVRFPEEFKSVFASGNKDNCGMMRLGSPTGWGIPLLVMNKIGIEHAARDDGKYNRGKVVMGGAGGVDLVDNFFAVRKHLEGLQADSGRMRQALEELRAEIGNSRGSGGGGGNAAGKFQGGGGERGSGIGGRMDGEGGGENASEELKKGLMGA